MKRMDGATNISPKSPKRHRREMFFADTKPNWTTKAAKDPDVFVGEGSRTSRSPQPTPGKAKGKATLPKAKKTEGTKTKPVKTTPKEAKATRTRTKKANATEPKAKKTKVTKAKTTSGRISTRRQTAAVFGALNAYGAGQRFGFIVFGFPILIPAAFGFLIALIFRAFAVPWAFLMLVFAAFGTWARSPPRLAPLHCPCGGGDVQACGIPPTPPSSS
jgi:hypothetical protein